MPAGSATAADVPGKYDLVINGFGYCLLDSLEPSIPFRTHRAIYGQTQPFVERQNVSNSYGDNAQDFFQTIRQRDWSLGEQQRFFRAGQDGRYWMGKNVDVTIPGQVSLSQQTSALTFAAAAITGTRDAGTASSVAVATSTTLYSVDPVGTITSRGAHGLGAAPARFGSCSDGQNVFLSTTAGGSVGIRKWDGASFTTFSATAVDTLAFVNNTVYGFNGNNLTLYQFDSSGTATAIFTWKSGSGAAAGIVPSKIEPFGGKLLILMGYGQDVGGELWIYDGTGAARLEVFPSNFFAYDLEVLYGVAYVSGSFVKPATSSTVYGKPAIHFFDGSQVGLLWQASDFNTTVLTNTTVGPHPTLGTVNGRLVFTDDTTGNILAYNPVVGGVSTVGTYTQGGDSARFATAGTHVILSRNQTAGYLYPATTFNTSGYVISSLIDFDSSLTKVFRGVTIEFNAASDGNGGSVDVDYQLNSLTGSWTSLATGVTAGTEVLFPAAITGHSITFRVTLNKGTSTSGPTLKSYSVRGAPVMPIYPRGQYIIDCTGNEDTPRELRDGGLHPLTGYEQVQNLVTARSSATPISITDRVSGTYTGFVDVNDPEGFDVYEEHPATDNPKKSGSFVVRLTTRGV